MSKSYKPDPFNKGRATEIRMNVAGKAYGYKRVLSERHCAADFERGRKSPLTRSLSALACLVSLSWRLTFQILAGGKRPIRWSVPCSFRLK